jgi:tetratricopeptide (TPR) repeat protein
MENEVSAGSAGIDQGAGTERTEPQQGWFRRRLRALREPSTGPATSQPPALGFQLLGTIGIVVCVLAAYWPALHAGFIWDDDDHVTGSAVLRSLDGLRRLWLERGATHQYYPITHTSFWLEYHLWGLAPAGYHAVNLILHATNALLVWRLLHRLRVPGAFLAGAIFAVHPIQVESVAWVTERKNVLSGFFYLLAAGVYLRVMGLEEGSTSRRPSWWLDIAAVILFACALLSKSVTVTLPCAVALLIWWKRRRIERRELVVLGGTLAYGLFLSFQTAYMERVYVGAVGEEWNYTVAERVLIAGRALWFYLGKLAWPTDLLFVYPRWTLDTSVWWQWAFPVAALLAGGLLFAIRRVAGYGPLVAALYYAGTLVPALGFFSVFPMAFSFVANHFVYLATIGPIALAASAGTQLAANLPRAPREVLRAGAVLLILTFVVLSNRESRDYRIPELWSSTIAGNHGCWICECNLGAYLLDQGQFSESIPHSERALALKPDFTGAMANLGLGLLGAGRIDEAITTFKAILARAGELGGGWRSPSSAFSTIDAQVLAQAGLGNALVARKEVQEGLAHLEEAVHLVPTSLYARLSLGTVLLHQGRTDEAVFQLEQAVRLHPTSAKARAALAEAQSQSGWSTKW